MGATLLPPLRIFVGYDGKEAIAYHVLAHSIIARASVPVSITPLARHQLAGWYRRERTPIEATDFSLTRFLVPALCGFEGYAVFMDCDMLCRVDIAELYWTMIGEMSEGRRHPKALLVCQHDYQPSETVKFLGQPQTMYPRKNWSSVMVFNNPLCRALSPEYVDGASGLELHRFNWIDDSAIGALPLSWSHLVGVYAPTGAERIVHFTEGGPWFRGYEHVDYSDEWRAERDAMLHGTAALEAYAA